MAMSVMRIIDANANRAREALRVMEEAARFILDDAALTGELKQLRHDLASALRRFANLEFHRDTPGDVGTAIGTETELSRGSAGEVVIAAGKRLSEALRAIEEYGKTLDADFAAAVEKMRYAGYELEQRLSRGLGTGCARQWRLCVLLTESICARPWEDVLRAAIDGGADCIQIREKEMDGGMLARRVEKALDISTPGAVSVVVNDRVDVALAAGADGVHVGQSDLSIDAVRRIAGRTLLVGASTHEMDEAKAAVEAGADYCGVGAMFATAVKPDRIPSGLQYLRDFIDQFPGAPHLAIGGITPENVGELVEAGCRGIAVSTAVCAADDPADAAAKLRRAFD